MDFFAHPPLRGYKFADSYLPQLADDIKQSLERDATELADYGVTPTVVIELMAKRTAFAIMPSDNVLTGEMMIATQAKNEKHKELEVGIRRIADRVRLKFGEGHGIYMALSVALLSRQSSRELVNIGRDAVVTCTKHLAELASEGITAPLLATITTLTGELDDLIDGQRLAVKDRDLAVFFRITAGNDLYAMIVNLAGKGKSCWHGVNEAKYNDYVIYPSGESSNTQTVEGTVGGTSVVNTSVANVDETTVITMKNTGTAPLHFFFAVNPTDTMGASEVVVAASETLTRTGLQLGYNPQANRFNVYNPDPQAGSYTVEW